jgi:hypothetical protein
MAFKRTRRLPAEAKVVFIVDMLWKSHYAVNSIDAINQIFRLIQKFALICYG